MNEPHDRRALAGETPLMQAILEAVREEMPGFQVTHRDVDLAREPRSDSAHSMRAEWMGKDGSGRRVLVGVCNGGSSGGTGAEAAEDDSDDDAILWAVEALACASRMHATGAKNPARAHRTPAGREPMPLVVLIVPACSPRLGSALSLLPLDSLVLLEMQRRSGSGRSQLRLLRCELRAVDRGPTSKSNGIEAWPATARDLAESLAVRVRRIDPTIERTDSDLGLRFRYRDEDAAMLSLLEGKLVGACGSDSDLAAIEDETGAEAWLERTLRSHGMRLVSGARRTRPADLLSRSGPLLSAEELAAFRDD